jgi:lysophospholipase L1-like esterase
MTTGPLFSMVFSAALAIGTRSAPRRVAEVTPQTAPQPAHRGRAAEVLARAIRSRDMWRRGREKLMLNDFGELGRFRAANAALAAPAPGEKRVVFFGDSITAGWPLDQFFPGKPYLNRGIGGQTTSQALLRFRQDVIDLKAAAVVILLGTNDIAGNTGAMSPAAIEGNLASMAELARSHKIAVVFSSVTPVHDYTPQSDFTFPLRPPATIRELNEWLKGYCAQNGATYLDYFSAMIDGAGLLRRELATDGLHPNHAGYEIMTPLAEAAIEKALSSVR